ncbi:alpha/beta hydrolase [Asanoa sp. WMMD1127]|uniref:alpha/beta fold hydrolase n=1 Tax=Asanoa sp. WMMD1127 TaxID=3016107 RepID=UPI002417495C|nr:alpha/beta hydrolase [Asanoa sp. WMMD1127]MDG4824448.1 alpha/beta hydrolase [Asanoa sp. WMMD1127]
MTETFVLVPGMWLGGWVWDAVAQRLRAAGDRAIPVTLAGVGERVDEGDADLEQHVADIVAAAEGSSNVVLVGHSYGGLPVTAAAARIPVSRVVYVDSGPLPDGTRQLDMGPPPESTGPVPPRPWEPADDPVLLAGLDDDALSLLRKRSTTHPYASVAQPLRRGGALNPPASLIASTFSLEQIAQMRAAGHPFFAAMGDDVVIRALPTGHWPMLSEPSRLASLLRA